MFVNATRIEVGTTQFRSLETATHKLCWEGLAYVDGTQAGPPSVAKFVDVASSDLPGAAATLKGNYFLAMQEKRSGIHHAFVDGSGLFHAFFADSVVSTSFLDLVAVEKLRAVDFNPESIVEFLHFGYLSFGKTFFDRIRRLPAEQIAQISPNGHLSWIPKKACTIDVAPECSFDEFLRNFVGSVSSERISLDLTGGIDSRLLAVCLQYFGLPFELAVSGLENSRDVAIATDVAETLGIELRVTRHDADDFVASLPAMFHFCDGLFDVAQAHNSHQMQSERVRRGITLMLTGVGGELFKDFWWLQDFPLYRCQNPNLKKLYTMRIAPIGLEHSYLSEPYAALSKSYASRFIERLSEYVAESNTQTYDQIYYRVKMRDLVGRFISNHIRLLPCYAPYLEPAAAAFGYHLPRRDRFFDNFHRRTITRFRPDVARIRTTQSGMTVSSEPGAIAKDLYKYIGNKGYRLARKVAEKAFQKRYSTNIPTSPTVYANLRQSGVARRALDRLKERGIIASDLNVEHTKDAYLCRVVCVSMLLDWIDSEPVGFLGGRNIGSLVQMD